jgi:choline dehydrogenase
MLEAVDFIEEVINKLPASTGLAPFQEVHPCNGSISSCNAAVKKENLKLQAYSHHASGTCAMGHQSNPMSVLDSSFRVRGVKGLRVVDASVFPKPPGFYPVLPTLLVSRKASEVILSELASRKD